MAAPDQLALLTEIVDRLASLETRVTSMAADIDKTRDVVEAWTASRLVGRWLAWTIGTAAFAWSLFVGVFDHLHKKAV